MGFNSAFKGLMNHWNYRVFCTSVWPMWLFWWTHRFEIRYNWR